MPFEDGSFDVVTANEMIEHIEDHDAFIEEVKRVLQPGGMFLVSTPNKPIYNRYKSPNPFHVSEMDIAEFRDLLESHFKHVHFTGLRMALVSASFDIDGPAQVANLAAAKTYRGFREGSGKPNVSNDEMSLDEPEYVLALCSDRAVEQDAAASTIFFSADDDLWSEHEKIMAWASQLHEEDEVLRADLRRSQAELEELRSALAEERRAHADRIDTPSVDNQQHLTISSRLLTRLTGSPVEPDPVAMVEAMFSLNEQLITQRSRLDGLAGAQRRAEELQSQIDAIRAERDELSGEFRSAQQRIDDLGGELEALRSERNRLVADVADIRQKLSDEVRQAQQRIDDLGGELETLRGERDRLEADLAETRNESEKAREEQRAVEDKFNAFKEASSGAEREGTTRPDRSPRDAGQTQARRR